MIKEAYTEKFYSYNSKYINNALALRSPQHDSLEIFARLCDTLSLKKNPTALWQVEEEHCTELDACDNVEKREELLRKFASEVAANFYRDDLEAVKKLCPTLTSFERDFPSVCFALATGIGKTRLMGACIAYLHYEKGIKNFFVMAPNLTIYNKLKADLGNTWNPKYVFHGLDKFVDPPRIIDGDNYADFRQSEFGVNDVVINIFNIAKLFNKKGKSDNTPLSRIKRLNEVLGESYFAYLQSLDDLCIFMDESHHYRADNSFDVINELRPILGVELTATPQTQSGSKKIDFKNVVYEYSLAHALNDKKYVKVPVVFTRKDFRPEEYTPEQLDHEKLNDGLRLHEETKSQLEIYARTYGKPIVKPFVLVVAKDTEHSKQIRKYVTSDDFFHGYYKDKVLEINSAQGKVEKDDNIEQLLSLESPDNKIEIVIHVNMLKEGWDVTNLYTIVPLRASASDTLTEQTIGRGLRLPYGERTGVDEVDRLSIVSHDKYEAIVNLANDPNSLVRRVYFIDEPEDKPDEQKVTVEMPTVYDYVTTDYKFTDQLAQTFVKESPIQYGTDQPRTQEQAAQVAQFVANYTSRSVLELNKQVRTFDATKDDDARALVQKSVIAETMRQFPEMNLHKEDLAAVVQKAIDTCVQALTDKVIPIPQAVIQPFTEVKQGFYEFTLDTRNMSWHPSDDTMIGTELQEGGQTFEYSSDFRVRDVVDTPENEIVRHIVVRDDIDYESTADLLYSLVKDAKKHFLTYLTEEEAERVMRDRQKTIADMIYTQMREHFYREEVHYRPSEMRPFSKIETSFGGKFKSDEIYDLRANIPPGEVRGKIFNGFNKACHTLYKFDSNTERTFAIVLERDGDVLKWLRPSPKQFNIYYGASGIDKYEPDFIVETESVIFMVETKASNKMRDRIVLEKAAAAIVYCNAVSSWNAENEGKPWTYALVSHDDVRINSSFKNMMDNRATYEQMGIL